MVSATAKIERSSLWVLQTTLVFLYVLDFYLTRHYLGHVGLEGEYNPLMRALAESYGVDAILGVKLLALTGMICCMFIVKPVSYKFLYVSLALVNIIMIAVIAQGIYVISTL